ncbi:heterogeneous nuclear ribonucleoprotein K-like [Tubulanus polymorphus]|uniref:heterogeneous nuclear ribonucleoprotein K-like n=1 Tax=Tubulanus polymorphus TaxID=672921 RepID=UPI003DA404E1
MAEEQRGMKRQAEDDTHVHNPNLKKCRGEGPKYDLRILIQSKDAGAIIGKAGSNIKRLRNEYQAGVQVPDSQGPERILTISAHLGTVLECLLDIIPTLEDYQNYKDMDFDCELRMLVHQSQAGCIIGRAGYKIKELREQTNTKIKVFSECCPDSTERVILIGNKPVDVVNCIGTIIELLHNQAPPKGPSNPYDPYNANEYCADEYGGHVGMERGGGRSGGRSYGDRGGRGGRGRGGGDRGGRRDGGGRGGYGGGRDRDGGGNRRGGMNMQMSGGRMGDGYGNSGAMGAIGGSNMCENFDQDTVGGIGSQGMMFRGQNPGGRKEMTQVTIPNHMAGAIIGKNGSRIQNIRTRTNAGITINDEEDDSNDRIITITGTPEQIQFAQFLLQQSARQYGSAKW